MWIAYWSLQETVSINTGNMFDKYNWIHGNENGRCHRNQTSDKVEESILMFHRVKNHVTLFHKLQLARLSYLNSFAMLFYLLIAQKI
jgi:hypothetical protein